MYAIIHEGMIKPFRSQTARGALRIARSFAGQGRTNVQVFNESGEALPVAVLAARFGEEA